MTGLVDVLRLLFGCPVLELTRNAPRSAQPLRSMVRLGGGGGARAQIVLCRRDNRRLSTNKVEQHPGFKRGVGSVPPRRHHPCVDLARNHTGTAGATASTTAMCSMPRRSTTRRVCGSGEMFGAGFRTDFVRRSHVSANLLILWRSQPDSNRCTSLERAVSEVFFALMSARIVQEMP